MNLGDSSLSLTWTLQEAYKEGKKKKAREASRMESTAIRINNAADISVIVIYFVVVLAVGVWVCWALIFYFFRFNFIYLFIYLFVFVLDEQVVL